MPLLRAVLVAGVAWAPGMVAGPVALTDLVQAGECIGTGLPFVFDDSLRMSGLPSMEVASEVETAIGVASLISMDYADNFKVLTHKTSKEQYVLTQCGTEAPSDADVDKLAPLAQGFSRKHFVVPLRTAIAESTTTLGFIEALDIQDRFSYISQWATGACYQKAQGCGDTGLSSDEAEKRSQMASVDAVFMDCGWDGSCDNVRDQANGVLFSATQDAGNLHSAEYIKYLAAFFNLEPEAKQHFKKTVERYNSAAQNIPDADKPLVAWLEYSADAWSTPPRPHFKISQAIYKLQLVQHAGGRNLDGAAFAAALGDKAHASSTTAGTDYKVYIDEFADAATASSALFDALSAVQAIIDETYDADPSQYNMAQFLSNVRLEQTSSLSFVQNEMVLRYDGQLSAANGWDWYESRVAFPDAAVQGLVRMLQQDASMPATYFRNLAKGESVRKISSSDCEIDLPVCGDTDPRAITAPAETQEDSEVTTSTPLSTPDNSTADTAERLACSLGALFVATAAVFP